MVQSRDVIGWTNEEEYSLISFNFADNHLTRFYSFEADVFPAINETIILDGVVYPGVFSVAVEIRPGSPPTGAPNAGGVVQNRQLLTNNRLYLDKKLSYRRGTARCVMSIVILPIATQQCRNYLYDKS